jgi:hypothetical protein
MSKNSSANRTELATGPGCRVELDEAGTLHVHSGDTCLQLDREACEDLAVTLARAVITLAKRQSAGERRATLRLV